MACSDCRIDFGVSIHVCAKRECITAHELKCPHAIGEQRDTYRKALDAIWHWCQLQPGDNALEAICHIEELVDAAFGRKRVDTSLLGWPDVNFLEFKTDVDAMKFFQLLKVFSDRHAQELAAAKAETKKEEDRGKANPTQKLP